MNKTHLSRVLPSASRLLPSAFFAVTAFCLLLILLAGSTAALTVHAATPTATTIPVVFVPGIGGTRLADSNNAEYWTAAGYPDHNDLTLYPNTPHPTLYPTNAITEATFLGVHVPFEDWQTYGPLFAYLSTQNFVQYNNHQNPYYQTSAGCDLTQAPNHPNLFVFAYDWRISNAQNAVLLADYIACVQKFYPNTTVNLVAHSMGGLVARRYILDHPGATHVNALISISSPWLGAGKVVWVEETGQYVFFVWASTLINVVASFNGASELINSQSWYDIGGKSPLIEDGQDLLNDGQTNEQLTYPQLVQYLNSSKGQQGFLPGTANQSFHSFTSLGNQQDNWSADTTGIQYFHIMGAGGQPDTITQVVAASFIKCLEHYSICNLSTWMYPKFGIGDTTVPELSLSRNGPNGNYNAPNATLYRCQSLVANSQNVDHTGILSNPVAEGLLVQYLAQANGAPPQPPPGELACGWGSTVGAPKQGDPAQPYHRLTLSGVTNVKITDGSNDPITDGAAVYQVNADSTVLLLNRGKTYTISFKTTAQPFQAEWLYTNAKKITKAQRYLDVTLKPNVKAQFILSDKTISALRYDSNGDGTLDTNQKSTLALQGANARDLTPPVVSIDSGANRHGALITLTAKDEGSGVNTIVYSTDGTHFQPYTAPFHLPAGATKIYAFADDNSGNRSTLTTFTLK